MIDEFFKTCRKVVTKHDGIVDHFLGDAVLAFFNVPIKREDHIATAVRTACEIQKAMPEVNAVLGEEGLLKVGIGVSTGLAFTGVVGSTSCNDYTALGDSVNIASRLQGQAAPGEVLVTDDVYVVLRDEFPNAEERILSLKGIGEPVKVHSISIADWKGSPDGRETS